MPGHVLLAVLPDPAQPTVLAFGAALGAFVGNTIARVRGEDPDQRTNRSLDSSYWGMAFALGIYLTVNLTGVYA